MGNKATQPRSFNTIRRSQTKARAQRRRTQRVVLLAIFATVALILVSLLVLGGFAIVNAIIDARPNDQENDPPAPPAAEITFVQTTKSADDIHKGQLLLVNEQNRYTFPTGVSLLRIYDNMTTKPNGSTIYRPVSNDYKLEAEALQALNAMMYKYYELDDGSTFAISSAYRTMEDQEALNSSVQPGYSDHHTGYCVAVQYSDRSNLESDHWFYQNCYKYGFVVRYPEGKESITGVSDYKHCLRYVGVAHATYMYEHNLCMEEYLDLLKNSYSSAATRLSITAADGSLYDVYYVAASGSDITTLDVPTSDFSYTVSGDNRSGFIVTVKMTDPAA